MIDRLTYAFLGAVSGAIIGVVCWFLYGLAFSSQLLGMGLNPEMLPWVKALAILFAVIGLVLKDSVGAVVGNALTFLFSVESGHDHEPNLSVCAYHGVRRTAQCTRS
jgi:hypothetical protein